MGRFFARFGALFAVASSLAAWGVGAAPVNQPLRDSEVLALVAGGALPDNVVHEITSRGLGFRVTDEYRSQLKLAGAQTQILAARWTVLKQLKKASSIPSCCDICRGPPTSCTRSFIPKQLKN